MGPGVSVNYLRPVYRRLDIEIKITVVNSLVRKLSLLTVKEVGVPDQHLDLRGLRSTHDQPSASVGRVDRLRLPHGPKTDPTLRRG